MQVDPDTAYVKEEFGQRDFSPNSNNEFNLPSSVGVTILSLIVEGTFLGSRPVGQIGTSVSPIPGPSSANSAYLFNQKGVECKSKGGPSYTKEIAVRENGIHP